MAVQLLEKTFHYRRVAITTPDGVSSKNLQDLIEEALKHERVPMPVKHSIGVAGAQIFQALVTLADKKPYYRSQCLCGEIVSYDKEQGASLVDDPDGEVLYQKTIVPRDEEGKQRNIEVDPVFFAVRENHVAICSSSRKWKSDFEDFLHWLISDLTDVSPRSDFELMNVSTKEAQAKAKKSPVKSFSLKSTKVKESKEIVTPKGQKKKVQEYRDSDWVKRLLGFLAKEKKLGFDPNKTDTRAVSATISFSFSQLRAAGYESANDASQQFLTDMATHMGESEDMTASIELENGDKIKGNEMTIQESIKVQVIQKRIAPTSAMTELGRWLTGLCQSGRV